MTSLVDGMQPRILVNFGYGGRTMILADKIIEERKKNGWTQEDLAQKLGVSRQSVSNVYLGWSLWTKQWDVTYMIWPVAAVLYAAMYGIVKMIRKVD